MSYPQVWERVNRRVGDWGTVFEVLFGEAKLVKIETHLSVIVQHVNIKIMMHQCILRACLGELLNGLKAFLN